MTLLARGQSGASALPPLAAFDPGVLQAMFGPESGVISDVLETFYVSMDGHVLELKTAAASGETAKVVAIAHRIKGAARMSGALALAMAAEDLEVAGQTGPAEPLDRHWAGVWRQWRRLQRDTAFRRARRHAAADLVTRQTVGQ